MIRALVVTFWVLIAIPVPLRAQDAASDAEARSLFEAGRLAYDAGRFEDALTDFERAYALSARPELLFNIASAADQLRRTARALEAYRAYVEALPDAPNRARVDRRIAFLEGEGTEEALPAVVEPSPEPAPEPEPAPPPVPRAADPLPWAGVATGGGLAIVGVVLLAVGLADADAVARAPLGASWVDYRAAAERAPILEGTGGALVGVGLAMAGGCLVWALAGSDTSSEVSVAVGPTGIVVGGTL